MAKREIGLYMIMKCQICGKEYDGFSWSKYCSKCKVIVKRDRENKRHKNLKAQGLCICCRKPVEKSREGKIYCEKCANKISKYGKQYYYKKVLKQRQARIIENKKCERCGKPLPFLYKRFCDDCRKAKNTENKLASYYKKRKLNICVICGNTLEQDRIGKTLCKKCATLKNMKRVRRYHGYKTINKTCDEDCENCKYEDCILDEEPDLEMIEMYRTKLKKQRDARKDIISNQRSQKRKELKKLGLCSTCREPLPENYNYVTCPKCRSKRQKYYNEKTRYKYGRKTWEQYIDNRHEWLENGLCFLCGKPVVKGQKVCKEHYNKYMENYPTTLKPLNDERKKIFNTVKLRCKYLNSGKQIATQENK